MFKDHMAIKMKTA